MWHRQCGVGIQACGRSQHCTPAIELCVNNQPMKTKVERSCDLRYRSHPAMQVLKFDFVVACQFLHFVRRVPKLRLASLVELARKDPEAEHFVGVTLVN